MLQDIPSPGPARVVANWWECRDYCYSNTACSVAVFYSELVSGSNCWLRTTGDACSLPSHAVENEKATLLLKCDRCTPLSEAAAAAGLTSLVVAIDGVKVRGS